MGNRRKARHIQEAAGNPGHRGLNPETFIAPPGIPEPPPCIQADPLALEEWTRVLAELAGNEILSRLDAAVVCGYCLTFATAVRGAEAVRQQGAVISLTKRADTQPGLFPIPDPASGPLQRNPNLGVMLDALKVLRGYAAELGFSPLSRGRITPMPPTQSAEQDEAEKFFFGSGSQ